jgi:hypothetical protein
MRAAQCHRSYYGTVSMKKLLHGIFERAEIFVVRKDLDQSAEFLGAQRPFGNVG